MFEQIKDLLGTHKLIFGDITLCLTYQMHRERERERERERGGGGLVNVRSHSCSTIIAYINLTAMQNIEELYSIQPHLESQIIKT